MDVASTTGPTALEGSQPRRPVEARPRPEQRDEPRPEPTPDTSETASSESEDAVVRHRSTPRPRERPNVSRYNQAQRLNWQLRRSRNNSSTTQMLLIQYRDVR